MDEFIINNQAPSLFDYGLVLGKSIMNL